MSIQKHSVKMRATLGILKVKKAATVTASAVAVGIGLLASPFLAQANDEEKTGDAPEVGCLWVSNHGFIGFEVEFDVTSSQDGEEELDRFRLGQDGLELTKVLLLALRLNRKR